MGGWGWKDKEVIGKGLYQHCKVEALVSKQSNYWHWAHELADVKIAK